MAGDPLKVASDVSKLLMENNRVRVFIAKFQPGVKAAMHSHPDHVIYVLNGSKIKMTSPGKKATDIELKTGQAIFLEAQSHEVVNIGKTNLELLIIELKE